MICCVTGHRPKGFPFVRSEDSLEYCTYLKKMTETVDELICEGYQAFISGMADGADMDFAKTVIRIRDARGGITLEGALPYSQSRPQKNFEQRTEKEEIVNLCDCKTIVSDHYYRGCMHKRNRYMVDKADIVLAVWNGVCSGGTWETIKYARKKGKFIRYIMLNEISPSQS